MARQHPDIVRLGLRLKKIGNRLLEVLGGRAVHPISPCVGGFHGLPPTEELHALEDDLSWGVTAAAQATAWAATLKYSTFESDYEFVSLKGEGEYPFNHGDMVSSSGLRLGNGDFDTHFEEFQLPHSTALHARRKGGGSYLVGPMARLFHNHQQLLPAAQTAMTDAGYDPATERNPYRSIIARCIEMTQVFEDALGLVQEGLDVSVPHVAVTVRAGEGAATTEAPRGILVHRYAVDEKGLIENAVITPPTSQNQGQIEADLRLLVTRNLHLPDEQLGALAEGFIRNYDPCISCAAHFLKLSVARG